MTEQPVRFDAAVAGAAGFEIEHIRKKRKTIPTAEAAATGETDEKYDEKMQEGVRTNGQNHGAARENGVPKASESSIEILSIAKSDFFCQNIDKRCAL